MYFQLETVETIAQHIMALYSAKIFAFIKNQNSLNINLEREEEDSAVYINTSRPGISLIDGLLQFNMTRSTINLIIIYIL